MKKTENKKLLKLKRAKKRKRNRRIIVLSTILLLSAIVLGKYNQEKNIKDSTSKISKETISNKIEENTLNTTDITNPENIEVEFVEYANKSETIENVVQQFMKNNNLNDTNFAFFYYNPEDGSEYFFNENTYFTAASTIKVPLAMIYYDKINNGDLKLTTTLSYDKEDYEIGAGNTSTDYKINDKIPISYLLEQMIINSDNTAANILKNSLGGENAYRILIKQYTTMEFSNEFNEENITTAQYSRDVLKRLYEHQTEYQSLINLMKQSSNGEYLKKEIKDCEIAHKYGNYEGYVHDYGIVYTKKPYLIGIFTKDVDKAENLIATLSKVIYDIEK